MSSNFIIDFNADIGEGIKNEEQLLPYLSSCNIACGGHYGDYDSMNKSIENAKKHNLKIGAHPSFPDRKNFGRVVINISSNQLYNSLLNQVKNLNNILKEYGIKMHHIKPHGALYNLAVKDETTSNVIIEVIKTFNQHTLLYAPSHSVLAKTAKKNNINVIAEAFADRRYNDDLSLVSRTYKNAVIHSETEVFKQVQNIIKNSYVTSITNKNIYIEAKTICVHSDHENTLAILKYLSNYLKLKK